MIIGNSFVIAFYKDRQSAESLKLTQNRALIG